VDLVERALIQELHDASFGLCSVGLIPLKPRRAC
jgi:hypothetical protein